MGEQSVLVLDEVGCACWADEWTFTAVHSLGVKLLLWGMGRSPSAH